MELFEIKERLQRLDTDKLIDVVKNHRQYGYNDEIRNYALGLLEAKGITSEDLLLTGNLENRKFDQVNDVLTSFKSQSKKAFLFYVFFIILRFLLPSFSPQGLDSLFITGSTISLILYVFFLLRSFQTQSEFYRLTGDEYGSDGAIIYLVLGMPFYIFMYFIFRNQMDERSKMIT